MKSFSTRLLTVTPLIMSTMATSALAQEVATANPVVLTASEATVASVESTTVVFPLKVTVPADATYVFTSPANNGLTISLDRVEILSVPGGAATGEEPYRVITSLTAGDHLIE